MKTFELIAPCHFGLEAVLKREIYDLGYEIIQVEDGRVTFEGDEEAVCRANIFLRTAERVLLKAGQFHAETFEELFQGIKNIPWEDYIPKDGRFWVAKASSIKSRLFSPSDIQSIVKKAMVERMKGKYHMEWFPADDQQSACDGDAGCGIDFADPLEKRPDSGGPFLRKRNVSHRGGYDGG